MTLTKATCQYSKLENGSYVFEVHAQWDDYHIKSSSFSSPPLSPKMVHQSVDINMKSFYEFGVSISYLSNPSATPYFNTTSPTTMPQLRLVSNSSTLTPCGFLEFSIRSFGIEPSQSIRTFMPTLSKIPGNNFCSLFREQGEHIPYSLVVDIYDLRAT